jgi:hypothetical protein
MKHLLTLVICAAVFSTAYSQSFKYRKYNYEWKEAKPEPIAVDEQFRNEDAVILDEKCIYNVSGDFRFSPAIQKHLQIKFLTKDGIKKHSTIILPESFDPISERSSLRPELRDSIYRPKGEFECIRYFAARIIKPDGSVEKAIIDEAVQTEIFRINQVNRSFFNWMFNITNLSEGDILELDYSYDSPHSYDPSHKIYFNGSIPKQNFNLTFRYPEKATYIINYHNGAEPYDSVMVTVGTPHYTEYYFSKKYLTAGILEPGARPYKQLPHISYYYHDRSFGILDTVTKFIKKALPYPWSYVSLSEVEYQVENLKVRLQRMDNTTRTLNDFIQSERNKIQDTTVAAIMASIQHTLATEFDYIDDINEYAAGDAELQRLGKYITEKKLRGISRDSLYYQLFLRLDRHYYKVVLADKRINSMDINRYERLTGMHAAYAIPIKNTFIYFYPKSYRFGYEANELPFYFEDIHTILIPQHEPFMKKFDYIPMIDFSFHKTPFSGVKDNTRTSTVMVNASVDSMKLTFNAKLKLTGQFSTITRGYYIYGSRDTTVNPDYYNTTLSALADNADAVKWNTVSSSRNFPYETVLNTQFANKQIQKESDNSVIIAMAGWINNVIDRNFTSVNRHLDYYPDFQFMDSHKYMIKFDRKVELQNAESYQKNLDNSFASFTFKVSQVAEESILIEINYIVKPESVPAVKAHEVAEVFNTIQGLDHSSLKVKIL